MKRNAFLLSILGGAVAGSSIAGPQEQPAPGNATRPPSRAEQLAARIIEDTNAAYFIAAAYIGDRLGLFKAMAGAGPLTADQLAAKLGLHTRYVLEWLRTMAAAHYLEYHPDSKRF